MQKRATALCGTVERLAEALGIATERASASESTATSRNAVATHLLSLRVLLAAKVVRRQIDSASRTAGSADVAASLFTMQERLRQMFSNVRDALDLDLEDGETGEASTASSADSLSGPALSAAAPGSSSDGPTQASKDNRYRIA